MSGAKSAAPRERLSSRLGFVLLSAGCAIGLGNVWRFPYVVGQNGGGWFVALYLVFLVLIGLPILVMEFAVGRAARRSLAKAHAVLTPDRPAWRLHGLFGTLGCVILMMFYTTVTGWMLLYFRKSASGAFAGLDAAQIADAFGAMLGDPLSQTVAMALVTVAAATVCAMELSRGLERVTKWLMLCLLVLIVVLAVNSVLLPGASKGLSFYLLPDSARMRSVGMARVLVEAMNHAFFTLSIGIGSMAIFGSYIGRERALLREGLHVAAVDTFVAIMAGLVIIPACFALGLAPTQGPGLVFVTLPNVFCHMPGGRFWGAVFFLFMCCAAFTTVLAVFECVIACLRDYTGWSRVRGTVTLACAMPVLAMPCILGFNVWKGFQPFGEGSSVLDLEDFLVSDLLLPLGGLAFVIYCGSRFGWGWTNFQAEANAGKGPAIGGRFVRGYCIYALPALVVAVFIIGLLAKFKIIAI